VTGNIFIADRSNASVDIFSGSSLTFLGRAEGFTGQQATNSISGADGVLTVTSGGVTTLYAGDGSSTLRVYDATNPAAPVFRQAILTGGTTRVDEMAYSPVIFDVRASWHCLEDRALSGPAGGDHAHSERNTGEIFSRRDNP
jgi:hypothetical protein